MVLGVAVRAATLAQFMVDSLDTPNLSNDDAHHLVKVLRARNGERVSLIDGAGAWRVATYADGALQPATPVAHEDASLRRLAVAFAPLKGDRTELVVQKLTEIGVDEITLLSVDHAAVQWKAEKREKMLGRLQRIAYEAAMQSRRVRLPLLKGPMSVADAVVDGYVLTQWGGDAVGSMHTKLAVGPEGGWSPGELSAAQQTVTLGNNVLRAETAAIVAGALLTASTLPA